MLKSKKLTTEHNIAVKKMKDVNTSWIEGLSIELKKSKEYSKSLSEELNKIAEQLNNVQKDNDKRVERVRE